MNSFALMFILRSEMNRSRSGGDRELVTEDEESVEGKTHSARFTVTLLQVAS